MLSPSSRLKMGTEHFSETFASANQFTWHHNLKEHHQNCNCLKHPKSYVLFILGLLTVVCMLASECCLLFLTILIA
jgi:hypothetical protein